MAAPDITAEMNPADLSRLLKDIREFDAELAKMTRKRLRAAAEPAIAEMRGRLLGGRYKYRTGMTKLLAKGIRVSIKTGARKAGITIEASNRYLPEGKKAMARAFNKASFRHPVFPDEHGERNVRTRHAAARRQRGEHPGGRDWVWVHQAGRPYFGSVLDGRKRAMAEAMEQALKDAAETIRAGVAQ